jgi:hypothetical protein
MISSHRVGYFFSIIGGFLLILFVASDIAEEPNFNIFFFGLAGLVIGLIMANHNRPQKENSARFRWIRSMLDRRARDKYK